MTNNAILKSLVYAWLVAAAVAPPAGHAGGDPEETPGLRGYTAVYELEKKGMTVAEATFTLEQTGGADEWRFQSSAEPKGLAALLTSQTISENSLFGISAGGRIHPLSYAIEHSDAERARENDLRVQYDRASNTASVNYRGKTTQIALDGGLYDPLSEQAALMLALPGAKDRLDYRVVDDGRAEQHRYRVRGEEVVAAADASHPSVKLVREHGKRRTVMWFARDLNYLPVKIQQYRKDELKSQLLLDRVSFQ